MPYSQISELPGHVKKYTQKRQRQWMHVFNTMYNKYQDEGRAFAAANSILKKTVEKHSADEDRTDVINIAVDKFLKNI